MNVFNTYREIIERILADLSAAGDIPADLPVDRISVEPPRDASHGDISTNVAMVLSKPAGMKPRDLAEIVAARLEEAPGVEGVDVAGPGFVNLRLSGSFWQSQIGEILKQGVSYGDSQSGAGRKVNVEYVSANPTGPMHVGHARGAVIGDVLASLTQRRAGGPTAPLFGTSRGTPRGQPAAAARARQSCGLARRGRRGTPALAQA